MTFRASLDIATNPTCQNCVCSLNYRAHSPVGDPASKSQDPILGEAKREKLALHYGFLDPNPQRRRRA